MGSIINIYNLGIISREKYNKGKDIIDEQLTGFVRECVIDELKTLLYNALYQSYRGYKDIILSEYHNIGKEDEKKYVKLIINKLLYLEV